MQQRFYFNLFKATQILGGAAYLPEIKKLRNLGAFRIVPFIKSVKYRDYPLKITFTFYAYDDCDMITAAVLSGYIMRLMESHTTIQSADARVVPQVFIKTQRIISKDNEGCEIQVESIKD